MPNRGGGNGRFRGYCQLKTCTIGVLFFNMCAMCEQINF